ncbi:hypothetical protein BDB00DRAFT_420634 [Zychaea mexicana]|uniref:uncharacterized protein n=1 Tax=Zychaea mexicana TaxID=64656 RepID=UPI0022FEA4B6|nr:uncharacterized protein BDB00DRAFT_420634 [Zychaea mexicana]KAI9492683.1 hypothetical protein BDB00DRAFT_420634 [Zychaea mexicana]
MAASIDPNRKLVAPEFDLNEDQLAVFTATMDTFIAKLNDKEVQELTEQLCGQPNSIHTAEEIKEFAQHSNSSLNNWPIVKAFLNRALAADKRQELAMILTLLSLRPGSFLLTGHYQRFQDLTRQEREQVVLKWKNSYIPQLRLLYKMFFSTTCHPTYGARDSGLHRGMQYPGTGVAEPEDKPAPKERFSLLNYDDLVPQVKFDAIVIGSGAGGGVTASELAKAGKSVLVIDKGKYYHEDDMELLESTGFANMYEYGGFFSSYEGSMNILAGSVFGGGTTVNWSASLKLQHFVREEWARQGLTHFISPKFARDLDRVFERIGASTAGIKHNGANSLLIKGCQELGYHSADLHQNTDGKSHECNFCFTGCKDGIKNGTMNSWLRDAKDHGAKFLDRSKVTRVLIEKGRAVGVEVIVHYDKKVTIRADQVVVAASSLHTPGILQRSGLTNKNIGQNLRLHPCSISFGFFDENVDCFKGSIMTAVSNVAENVDSEGYGAKIEVPCLHPGSYSTVLPWRGAAHHKSLMLRYRKCAPMLILSRDKDSKGVVRSDANGNMVVDFELSNHDRQSILEGIERSLKILCAAGARELHTGQFGVDPFAFQAGEESRVDNPRFVEWLDKVRKYGLPQDGAGIFCAHQMGTCRMGVSPKMSVVKPTGETWEVKNLFVSDASLFPTASGVNPMVTTEALALHVADSIIKQSAGTSASKL